MLTSNSDYESVIDPVTTLLIPDGYESCLFDH